MHSPPSQPNPSSRGAGVDAVPYAALLHADVLDVGLVVYKTLVRSL